MPADKHFKSVKSITVGAVTITGNTGLDWSWEGTEDVLNVDDDPYTSFADVHSKSARVTIRSVDIDVIMRQITFGGASALGWTHEGGSAASLPDLACTVATARCIGLRATGVHGGASGNTAEAEFRCYSLDGATSPVSVSAA